MTDTNGMFVNDFQILPGQWRPQCPWEHIAWISPPWPSQYYLWLDLPETVFCHAGNLFLSHINHKFPALFPNLPKQPWTITPTGLSARRRLPNGVEFGVTIERRDDISVSLGLDILNGTNFTLKNIRTQTCSYLRGLKEFSSCTMDEKYVFQPNQGWVQLEQCGGRCDYQMGEAALPVIVARSSQSNRLIAMSWYEHTGPIWSNPHHPCIHADPCFHDLAPGNHKRIDGVLVFFEGTPAEFEDWFRRKAEKAMPTTESNATSG